MSALMSFPFFLHLLFILSFTFFLALVAVVRMKKKPPNENQSVRDSLLDKSGRESILDRTEQKERADTEGSLLSTVPSGSLTKEATDSTKSSSYVNLDDDCAVSCTIEEMFLEKDTADADQLNFLSCFIFFISCIFYLVGTFWWLSCETLEKWTLAGAIGFMVEPFIDIAAVYQKEGRYRAKEVGSVWQWALRDWKVWEAMVFFFGSCAYFWQSLIPFFYDDYAYNCYLTYGVWWKDAGWYIPCF